MTNVVPILVTSEVTSEDSIVTFVLTSMVTRVVTIVLKSMVLLYISTTLDTLW